MMYSKYGKLKFFLTCSQEFLPVRVNKSTYLKLVQALYMQLHFVKLPSSYSTLQNASSHSWIIVVIVSQPSVTKWVVMRSPSATIMCTQSTARTIKPILPSARIRIQDAAGLEIAFRRLIAKKMLHAVTYQISYGMKHFLGNLDVLGNIQRGSLVS